MALVECSVVNYMFFKQRHIFDRVHVKILIVSQDNNDVWSFILLQRSLLKCIERDSKCQCKAQKLPHRERHLSFSVLDDGTVERERIEED